MSRLAQDVARTASEATDVSRGCSVPAALPLGRTSVVPLVVDGQPRSFRLHVPSSYSPDVPTPLLVAFHGRHRSGALLEADTGLSGLPVLVAYPEGVVNQVGRLDWQIGPQARPGVDDVAMTRALIDRVQRGFCVDRDRVYALGHSNGGGMAVTATCAMPDRIAAVVAISGAFYDRAAGCVGKPISLLELHGTGDRVIPYLGGRLPPEFGDVRLPRISRWIRNQAIVNGCEGQPRQVRLGRGVRQVTWADCTTGHPVSLVKIDGGLHRVPTTRVLGGTPLAVVAWRFLRTQRLPSDARDAGPEVTTARTS
ncbi:alpha/beta hydrolase family esterase [Solicola sp. PLA-1-18]|uniref:alpha/beta hydrolase family esterase n=1 Tax=Solicola sp. PLA-1-18 TaxID=3380532 RepID=UPI003B76E254